MTRATASSLVLPVPRPELPAARPSGRAAALPVVVDGRHLSVGGQPWRAKAVTYGSFRPRPGDGAPFPPPDRVRGDLATAAAAGFNTVRTYALPPVDLLDAAEELGLRLLVGLHHDDWRAATGTGRAASAAVRAAGEAAVDAALERLDGRQCVAAVLVGNEVPGDLVRLHGRRRVEGVLSGLVARVHDGAPGLLVSYANYPTTEYLRIDGQDLACFNVFLHDADVLRGYLAHLAVTVGEQPLVVTELGVDARRAGPDAQAGALRDQLDAVDEVGCAGAAVFALTDDWDVGGHPVEGWQFGLQDRDRAPRPSFGVASRWAHRSLRDLRQHWPRLSVVVCAYQEQERLGRCLDSLAALDYPELEVIVCDDGSTDGTLTVARASPFRVLELAHGGLSAARNAGVQAANGDVVVFLDADATCHPSWPYHLALAFEAPEVVGAGGPNLPVHGAGLTARAVDLAPGNPVEVLVGPDRAEHVPGCNSAYRRSALLASGGYLPSLTTAGDDVDVCWRLLDEGGEVAFSPAAQVRHERRTTVRGYLRQQRGYGRAERMISGRHPQRFNRWGHATWSSGVYGGPLALPRLLPRLVAHGPAGSAAYQPVAGHRGARSVQLAATLVLPTALMLTLALLLAPSLLAAREVAAGCALLLLAYAAAVAVGTEVPRDEPAPVRLRALAVVLHLLQPLARAYGGARATPLPSRPAAAWGEDRMRWVGALHVALCAQRLSVTPGRTHDGHDLSAAAGPLLRARLTTGLRWGSEPVLAVRVRPRVQGVVLVVVGLASLSATAAPVGPALAALAVVLPAELLLLRRRVRLASDLTLAARSGAAP